MKKALTSPKVRARYDPNQSTVIAADVSLIGFGAVLLQVQDNRKHRPVSYASLSLSNTEKHYATVEKEALSATWASEKFSEYVLGMYFLLETDHKPCAHGNYRTWT